MKDMENNIKIHMKETIEEALKNKKNILNKIDEIFLNFKVQEKQMEDTISS